MSSVTAHMLPMHKREDGKDLFDDVLSLTRKMLAEIEDGGWESIQLLQGRREKMLHEYFGTPVSSGDAERVAAGIREMLDIDQVLMQKSRQMLHSLSGKLKTIKDGSNAVSVYKDNM